MPEHPLSYDMVIRSLAMRHWNDDFSDVCAVDTLEQGKVLFLPQLAFNLTPDELQLLTPDLVDPKRKNISFNAKSGHLQGVAHEDKKVAVQALLQRHHEYALQLVSNLLPEYTNGLHSPVNTLRLHPVTAWRETTSWRKDDTRLHVDAFPSRPNHGERILRIFTNINPNGESRQWRVGEPFPVLAKRFIPRLKRFSPLSSWAQNRLGITKRYRTHYDHLMLQLHDAMKSDERYQQQGPQVSLELPPGSSWICFSDQTPHAAMSGQFMLEQTFLLPVAAMKNPDNAPLVIMEKIMQRPLI